MRKLILLAVVASGCAEAAFSAHARDNVVDDIRRAMQMSQPPQKGSGAYAFLVTTSSPRELVGWDLAVGKQLWREKADVRSRIAAGRGLIVYKEGTGAVVARDPLSGRQLFSFRLSPKEKFVGATLDDEKVYVVVQGDSAGAKDESGSTGPVRRVSYVVGIDRGGGEVWRIPVQGSAAAPAARGGVVAVPYGYQHVSLLDGKTGKEVARVRNTDEQITFVRALPDGFYYGGGKGVYMLDEKSASGTKEGSSYLEANLGSDQVRTAYYYDGYQLGHVDYGAYDRNRILWRGQMRQEAGGGKLAFEDDSALLHSYRYIFSFDANKGKLKWAYAHPRVDIVSAEDLGQDIVFAAADGDVGVLEEKSGAVKSVQKTGLRLTGATFYADGWSSGAPAEKPDLLKALSQIVWDPDARFTAVKVFAVDAMGDVPGKDASAALLKIVLAPPKQVGGIPAAAQKKAGDELIARKDKEALPLYLDALRVHFDFLEDKQPTGLDVLARAVAQLDAHEAASSLGAHLLAAATPQTSLKELAAALGGLGGKDAAKALREFLLTYRADPTFLAEPSALTIAAEGLLKVGSADDRRAVAYVAEEKRTLPPVQAYLKKVLAAAEQSK
jgi:hypothetical protein